MAPEDEAVAFGQREHLAAMIERTLSEDRRVRSVARFGSLAADEDIPDLLSDIDIIVELEPAVSDLLFVEAVPGLVQGVAPLLVSSASSLGAVGYVAHLYFEGFSPWMHVDVRCESQVHEEDAGFDARHQWSVGYRHWLLAVKRLARSYAFLGEAQRDIAGVATACGIPPATARELRALLEEHHRNAGHVDAAKSLFAICSGVAEELETLACRP